MGWCWGGSQQRHLQFRVHPTSSSLETARNNERTGFSLGIERVVTERCWTESAGLRDRRQASDEWGRGGGFLDHGRSLGAFFFLILEFGVSQFSIGVFDFLCKFSQFSMALGAVVVVLWSSGGGCNAGRGRAQKPCHAQKPHRGRYARSYIIPKV
jgi:hypothetical protein